MERQAVFLEPPYFLGRRYTEPNGTALRRNGGRGNHREIVLRLHGWHRAHQMGSGGNDEENGPRIGQEHGYCRIMEHEMLL